MLADVTFKILVTVGDADQCRQMPTCRRPEYADAPGVVVVLRFLGAKKADRSLDIMHLGGKPGDSRKAIIDAGDGIAILHQGPDRHFLLRTAPPCSAMHPHQQRRMRHSRGQVQIQEEAVIINQGILDIGQYTKLSRILRLAGN